VTSEDNVLVDEATRVVIGEVGLGHDDDAARNAQQAADVEMFTRLRHDRFIRRHDQEHAVDSADAREHRSHEPLMARDVDKRDARVADDGVGKPELDGDAPFLLFLEPIRIDAGQRPDERAFPVIDVAGRADYEV
jgi:hypothetical protein